MTDKYAVLRKIKTALKIIDMEEDTEDNIHCTSITCDMCEYYINHTCELHETIYPIQEDE